MATWCLCAAAATAISAEPSTSACRPFSSLGARSRLAPFASTLLPSFAPCTNRHSVLPDVRRRTATTVCMAPEEEKMTRRSPLDFPIEWERPKPGRRPDIFPQFSPMKTPLPTPLPEDPPEEDEEEEEKKDEEEEDPEKEEPEKPEKESMMHYRSKDLWT